jgi:hypothetical protein
MVVHRVTSERMALRIGCAAINRIGKDAQNAVEAIDPMD